MNETIAVIGAGLAGLHCAQRLQAAGRQVTLFEKARGPGGRLATRRTEGYHFDHGAQYFKVHDPTFRELVSGWSAAGLATRWSPRLVHIDASSQLQPASPGEWWVGVPRMSAISRHLSTDLQVICTTRIQALQRQGDGWQLQDETGQSHGPYSTVLSTCPAPQTAEILADQTPLSAQIREQDMLPCWAMLAAFDEAGELAFDAATIATPPLSWIACNTSKPQRPGSTCWVLHAAHDWSRQHVDLPHAQIGDRMLAAFRRLTGYQAEPVYQTVHRWLYAKPAAALRVPCLYDPQQRLGAAGDWCLAPNVEGACLSGLHVADAVLADH